MASSLHLRRRHRLLALLGSALLVATLAACGGGGGASAGAGPGPGTGTGTGVGTGPDPGTGTGPGPTRPVKLFADSRWSTSHAQVVVDREGGRHLAYAYYEPAIEDRPTAAVYRYCASACDTAGAWQEVRLGSAVRSVQLRLSPQGQPRLLISTASQVYTGGLDHHYASCDGGCTQAAGWTVTRIFSGRVPASNLDNDDELPQRGFALDPQGRPRLVVFDENQLATPEHAGLYYLHCDERCDLASQWSETLVTVATRYEVERVAQPVLAFTPEGRPRIASAQFYALGSRPGALVYLACDEGCDSAAGWGRAELMTRGSGAEPSVDLAIDAMGRPRIAFYQEALLEGQGKRLFYLACDEHCLEPGRWKAQDLGLGAFDGQEPDLELDAQGRPRIAYADWNRGGVGLAWCDDDCAGDSGRWKHRVLEDRDALHAAWPVAYPPHCTGGLWNTLTPTLSLSTVGVPYVAFDATYHARCLYDRDPTDNIPPGAEMNLIVRAVRVLSVDD